MWSAETIEDNQSRMATARSTVDARCGEIAAMLLTEEAEFGHRYLHEGSLNTGHQYDEYGALGLDDGVAVFEGFTMPRGQKWQKIRVADERLMENVQALQWFEKVENRLFGLRNDPKSGFVTNVHQSAESLFAFWGQSMWIDKRYDDYGRFAGLSYQSEDVAGVFVERDAEGNPYRIHRRQTMTAEQILLKFREDAPKLARDAMGANPPRRGETFDIVHVIEKNTQLQAGRAGWHGMPWKSCYYSERDKAVFRIGGYRTLRRVVSCFARKAGRNYGRSPAMRILAALRASQVVSQDRVLGVEMMVKPPLLAPDDDLDEAIVDLGPWGITYGGLDEMLRERLKPLLASLDMSSTGDLLNDIHAIIDRGFFRHMLQLGRELKTHISATRTLEEIAEKGVLLAPLARQETEWFAPMLDVELDLMWEEGLLDDMPPIVAEFVRRGGGFGAIYDNELTRMMEAAESLGYLRTAEQISVIAALDKSVVPAFTREYPLYKVIPGLGRANGIPARWQATEEEKAARDAEDAAQVQLAQVIEAAPALSDTVKNLSMAGAPGGA